MFSVQALGDPEAHLWIIYLRKWTANTKQRGRGQPYLLMLGVETPSAQYISVVICFCLFFPSMPKPSDGYLLQQIQPMWSCLDGNARLIPITCPPYSPEQLQRSVNCVEGIGLPKCVATEKGATIAIVWPHSTYMTDLYSKFLFVF